jgi:hypothetical protein
MSERRKTRCSFNGARRCPPIFEAATLPVWRIRSTHLIAELALTAN